MHNELPIQINLPNDFLKEEVRNQYLVSSKMKKIWAVELDLLNELLCVCARNGLTIFSDGGTTLGAVRHGGFIPWDDDIDMVMMRGDYQKLCKVAEREFHYPYFFQTEYTDPGSMRGHAQLRNSLTTGILNTEMKYRYSFNQGIFIDIFPLDNIPDDLERRKNFFSHIKKKRNRAFNYANISSRYKEKAGFKGMVKKVLHESVRIHDNHYFKIFDSYMQKYNNETVKCVSKLFFDQHPENLIWERDWFKEAIYMPFEMLSVPIPSSYEDVLDKFFGNWRVPVKEAGAHGSVIFDVAKSYKEYI